MLDGGCRTTSPGGWRLRELPRAQRVITEQLAFQDHQADGIGCAGSGRSSRTRNTVLPWSIPGTAAICTASTRNFAHSTVSCGQRPISMKP